MWKAGKATLQELEEYYSIDDIMIANEVLDSFDEAEKILNEKQRKKREKGRK